MTKENQKSFPATSLLSIASGIVAAYVSNNSIRSDDLASIISTVHSTLTGLAAGQSATVFEELKAPAVSIKKSITPDFLICLEDGKKFRSMRRHLSSVYDMTPDQYRAKWDLPDDYPMVAPTYAASRSALAKSIGLGQVQAPEATSKPVAEAKGRGRPTKAA